MVLIYKERGFFNSKMLLFYFKHVKTEIDIKFSLNKTTEIVICNVDTRQAGNSNENKQL